ncbi:MAG: DUF5829 family protein [Bacteroidales bacterium]|nr:DUF5829 family protein [Bacteroidales bacterium]
MKKVYTLFFAMITWSYLFCNGLYAQEKTNLPTVCLNHLYVVLDSLTYQHLFESPFLRDSLGDCETDTITTDRESYFGKYLMGRNGYLELFSTKGFENATIGEVGLGFITFRSGDIWRILDKWQQQGTDSFWADTSFIEDKGMMKSLYYSIGLIPMDTTPSFYGWLMEYTPERLKERGFSDAELERDIPFEMYGYKRTGKIFIKLFDRITAVHLLLDNNEFEYLKKSVLGLGLSQDGNTFSNSFIKITCDIMPNPVMRIRTITLALSEKVSFHRIIINEHLVIELEGMTAVFTFN